MRARPRRFAGTRRSRGPRRSARSAYVIRHSARHQADASQRPGDRARFYRERPIHNRAMRYRGFGRTGWQVSEIGYGMWGMAGWTGSDDEESRASLDRAVALGCTFFDTAWAYG